MASSSTTTRDKKYGIICIDIERNMKLPRKHFHSTFSDFVKMLINPNISKGSKQSLQKNFPHFEEKIQGEKENEDMYSN